MSDGKNDKLTFRWSKADEDLMVRMIASLSVRGALKGKDPLGFKAWERILVSDRAAE